MPQQEYVDRYLINEDGRSPQNLGVNGYFDPSGSFSDVTGSGFSNSRFRPQQFIGDAIKSRAGQNYAGVGQIARAQGVQSVRGGEAQAISEARNASAGQGLGRGFANQQESNIRQQGTLGTTDLLLEAQDEENSRRYQQALALSAALIETNRVTYVRHQAERYGIAAANSANLGFAGSAIAAAGTVAGAIIGAG